jgi:Uncharacterized conserved protein
MTTNILKILLGLIFLISMTQFSIDLSLKEVNIPITGQSLAVLLVAGLLGAKIGSLTIALYLILGGFGLPVFANGGSGWETFGKGSGGFLYGFLIAGGLIGWLSNQWGIAKFGKNIGLMTIGTVLILVFGVGHLTAKYGLEKALEYGFYPFWPGAVIKIILGGLMLSLWHKMSNKIKG